MEITDFSINSLIFNPRDNKNCLRSIGNSIFKVSKVVPDGLLVFFASYPVMEKCITCWKETGIWSKICGHKPICVETKANDKFKETMQEYNHHIEEGKNGAIFMAVLRGKVSEGLDFKDKYARAVIIVGIPFAPMKDPKIILKQEYLDNKRRNDREMLTGSDWYQLDAIRPVNQAIGRVIRHKNDYGAILLFDFRYSSEDNKKNISSWVRDKLYQQPMDFNSIITELEKFFKECEQKVNINV